MKNANVTMQGVCIFVLAFAGISHNSDIKSMKKDIAAMKSGIAENTRKSQECAFLDAKEKQIREAQCK